MATKFPEFFQALAVEFRGKDVKTRPQGGRQLSYITARTVMNRLDEVAGPEGWWDEYVPMEHSVLCRLTLRLPDDTTLTKCDAGGYAGMTDQGDDDKSGFSDAFKRAAVKFGVGRHLYQDGTARLAPTPVAQPKPVVKPTTESPDYAAWIEAYCADINAKWVNDVPKDATKAPAEIVVKYQLNNHLLKSLGIPRAKDQGANLSAGEMAWQGNSDAMTVEARAYCRKQWKDAKARLVLAREPGADDNMPSTDEEAALDRMAPAPAE